MGASMKSVPIFRGSGVMPVFSRIFPQKLKYHIFGPPILKKSFLQIQVLNDVRFGVSRFSTRASQRVQESKSLIDDEAELSDWVSGLSSSSFKKTRVYSDSENDEAKDNVERGRYRSGERDVKRQSGSKFDKGFDRERKNESVSTSRFIGREGEREGRSHDSSKFISRREGEREGRSHDSSKFISRRGGEREGRSHDSSKFISRRGGEREGRSHDSSKFISGTGRGEEREGRSHDSSKFISRREGEREGRSHDSSNFISRRGGEREGRSYDSSKLISRRGGEEKFGRRLEEKSERDGSFFSKRNDTDSSKWGAINKGSRQKRPEMEDGKFRNRREEYTKRNDSSFGRGTDLKVSERWRDNEKGSVKQKEMWNGRDGGGEHGGFRLKGETGGLERRGDAMNDVKRERGGTERRGIIMNDDDGDEETEEGYMNFKGLIDSDEVDDDDDDDEEEEEEEVEKEEEEEEEEEEEDREEDPALFTKGNGFSQLQQSSSVKSASYLSETRFDQCPISPLSLKGIKDVGFEKMTLVQEATLPIILKGKDVLAKAKTGTGKTVAFLLPAIEFVLQSPAVTRDQKRPPVLVLVICPTRELANQAAAEANTLLKYHPSIGVQVVIGGTRLALEQKRMQANPCQILVATPGRLRDHVENTAGFATRLMGVKILVLDEADHLLAMGFRKAIEQIIAAVPKQRQTLLFSATIPEEVRQICHIALRRDHEFINTVQEGSEDTHSQVRQMHLVAPLDNHFSLLYTLLKDHIANDVNFKILVFCTTAMVTKLVAAILSELNLNVREIHSRKSQSVRTRISDEFRKSKGLILVTSDVSARGVDYPDVTLVVQIGVPSDREQYIHRLGRTGRKGKEGEGILLLAPWEEFFLSSVKDLPISKASEPVVDPETNKQVSRALAHVEMRSKEAAYQAWLGYYNSNKNVGRDKCRLVELANEFSRSMGLDNPPAIPKLVLGKMGLKNVPGLRSK